MPLAHPLPLPTEAPRGFPRLEREPVFDPARHLALEMPEQIIDLADLGYSAEQIADCPSTLGVTTAFRLLSEEGVACLQEVTRVLAPHARTIERISRMVRGGVYQSDFLRDFCQSPEVAEHISALCKTPVLPHSIPHQLGHLNYNPETVGENVDKWHVDTLRLDYVLFVTDPNEIEGGEFQYFHGTKQEMQALTEAGKPLPEDRIRAPRLPGAGYAVLQQGNMIVHRATALKQVGERITLVNGYIPAEIGFPDYTRFDQLYLADPPHVAASEYTRHVAWMGQQMLQSQLTDPGFELARETHAENLEALAHLLTTAALELRRADEAKMEHFGDG